ncbi:MAG TPA: amino acid synthesis family protein [Chloroflexota bacterium]|nr:amino acid synthesis family protein [Chloroflexota bacterium]
MDIRKTVTLIDDTLMDDGQPSNQPMRRVGVIAVVRNPLVGNNDEDLARLVQDGEDLGRFLAQRALEQIDRKRINMIGKAAIVGTDGQPEHGQAILFPKFAAAVREAIDANAARMFGEKKIAPAGSSIVVQLQSIDGLSTDPVGSLEVRVPGSPRPDEILVALVVAGSGGSA